jgi:hypothetical protein
MNQPYEIAERFLTKTRAASKNDLAYLRTVMRALLVLLIETAGKRNGLERRVAALEGRKAFRYCGVFDETEQYEPDDFVTHAGSMWHTSQATRARPGTPSSPWRLAVKRGRDR